VSPLRVLVVEDDDAVREGLSLALRHQGHDVFVVASGEQALENTGPPGPDVVILDVMLPGIDGLETCRRLRLTGNFPIIMLTARGDDADIVAGLEAGADDYVVKPVQPRVLEARMHAVLRRFSPVEQTPKSYGDVTIDRTALTVTKKGREIQLTPTELRLLLVLSESPLQVFSRDQLLRLVWEHDYLGDSRLVDACVQRLRSKIEDVAAEPHYIQTVRGFGYRFGPL
jgi:two-component system response regulator MtrA